MLIVSKKTYSYLVIFISLKNIPFFFIFAVFATLNTVCAVCLSTWKTTFFLCFVLKHDIHLWIQVPLPHPWGAFLLHVSCSKCWTLKILHRISDTVLDIFSSKWNDSLWHLTSTRPVHYQNIEDIFLFLFFFFFPSFLVYIWALANVVL